MSSDVLENNTSFAPMVAQVRYQGPIPEASQLAKYENILPGAADRIIKLAENKSKHVNEMEQIYLNKSYYQQTLGKIFALIAVLTGMVCGTICILNDHLIGGLVIGGVPLVSIAAIFVGTKVTEK